MGVVIQVLHQVVPPLVIPVPREQEVQPPKRITGPGHIQQKRNPNPTDYQQSRRWHLYYLLDCCVVYLEYYALCVVAIRTKWLSLVLRMTLYTVTRRLWRQRMMQFMI